jgi:hypothetical protein
MGTPVQRYVEFGLWPADRLLLVGLFSHGLLLSITANESSQKKITANENNIVLI